MDLIGRAGTFPNSSLPCLGKEDLSMGEDKKADKKRKRIVPKAPVQMIISREYVGTQTVTEAFVPIISEDIRKKIAEGDTFDNEGLSA